MYVVVVYFYAIAQCHLISLFLASFSFSFYANSPNCPSSNPKFFNDFLFSLTSEVFGGGGRENEAPGAAAGGGGRANDCRSAELEEVDSSVGGGRLLPNLVPPRFTVMVSPSFKL